MFKKSDLIYYIWATYHRKLLDNLQEQHKYFAEGIVLDIGGRDRGKFKKPKDRVDQWIFADINSKHNPDIVLDVANMQAIGNEKIDTIWAIELFEHVAEIQKGLKECYRVLKFNSVIVISVPFMYQVHGDPNDYQRWTPSKWKMELNKIGFEVKSLTIFGRFFTILCDFLKVIIKSFPPILKHLGYFFFPLLDLLQKLDDTNYVKKHPVFSKYHSGYFIIAKK